MKLQQICAKLFNCAQHWEASANIYAILQATLCAISSLTYTHSQDVKENTKKFAELNLF